MKKVGIITMIDNENCGNRLQNYALQEALKKLDCDVVTLKNDKFLNWNDKYLINYIKFIKRKLFSLFKNAKFKKFNKNITFSKKMITIKSNMDKINQSYDYFVVGSDQIWKPTRKRMSYIDLLGFAKSEKRISYAASFGLYDIEEKYKPMLQKELPKFKAISVREYAGKDIINAATGIEDVNVVLDPTLMIGASQWESKEIKPSIVTKDKFIFTYFLGDENIDYLKSQFNDEEYQFIDFYKNDFGPQEFLYLIHHAELILTDSFHACAFSIVYNKNFYIFERKQTATNNNMNSRIDTLCEMFNLESRRVNNIEDIDVNKYIDYKKVNQLLNKEQSKSWDFIKKALDIQ